MCKHSYQKSALVLEKSPVFVLFVILLAADPFVCLQLPVICLCNTCSHSRSVFLPLPRGPWWTSSAVLKMTSMPRKHSHSSPFSPHCPNSWIQPRSRCFSAFSWWLGVTAMGVGRRLSHRVGICGLCHVCPASSHRPHQVQGTVLLHCEGLSCHTPARTLKRKLSCYLTRAHSDPAFGHLNDLSAWAGTPNIVWLWCGLHMGAEAKKASRLVSSPNWLSA